MERLPFPSVDGNQPSVAGLIERPSPLIGPVVLAHSSIDLDGWSLDEARQTPLKVWWDPTGSWSRTLVSAVPIGVFGAIGAVILVSVFVNVLGLNAAVRPIEKPVVGLAVLLGFAAGWVLGMKFTFFLSNKRTGSNVLVGEQGVQRTRSQKGTIARDVIQYEDDSAWAEGTTQFIFNGISDGVLYRLACINAEGQVVFQTAVHDGRRNPNSRVLATWEKASELRVASRLPRVRERLARGDSIRFPILTNGEIMSEGTLFFDSLRPRPTSAVVLHHTMFTLELDGRTVFSAEQQDVRVELKNGVCSFRSRSMGEPSEVELGHLGDGRVLLAILSAAARGGSA
jgi:hypothetical protein